MDNVLKLQYNVLNNDVVTVNNSGKLTAVGFGETNIYVKDTENNLTAICKITVLKNSANSIAIPQIMGGTNFTAALKEDGTVWAWGDNTNGQLGDGTTVAKGKPTQVKDSTGEGVLTDIVKISVSYEGYVAALDKNGDVYTWGINTWGNLGDGTTVRNSLPAKVANLPKITDISTSYRTTYVVDEEGNVYGFGDNGYGQIGNNTTTQSSVPVKVIGHMKNVVQIGNGANQNTVLKSNGEVWSWGYNANGELGDGTTANKAYPVHTEKINDAAILENIIYIHSASNTVHAITTDNTVLGWGYSTTYGAVGDAATTNRTLPVLVKNVGNVVAEDGQNVLRDIVEIKGIQYAIIARNKQGDVFTWGNNANGELGDGTTTHKTYPTLMNTSIVTNGALTIGNGTIYQFVVSNNGEIYGTGSNSNNQLTEKITSQITTLAQIGTEIKSDKDSLIMQKDNEEEIEIGYNPYFSLINDTVIPKLDLSIYSSNETVATAEIVEGSTNKISIKSIENGTAYVRITDNNTNAAIVVSVKVTDFVNVDAEPQIAMGENHTVALRADGTVWAAGQNNYGQLGNGTNVASSEFVQVQTKNEEDELVPLENIVQIDAGQHFTLALTKDGNVYAWGYNGNYELGQGNTTNSNIALKVKGLDGIGYLENIVQVAAGSNQSLALDKDGVVWGWAENNNGELGDGTTTGRGTPIRTKFTNVAQIQVARDGSVILKNDGTVWTCGYYPILGTGASSGDATSTPVQVKTNSTTYLTNIVKISASARQVLALSDTGEVYAWGEGAGGKLGNNGTGNLWYATKVLAGEQGGTTLHDIKDISTAQLTSHAISNDGTLYSWGNNGSGAVSDGTTTNRTTPVASKYAHDMSVVNNILALSTGNGYSTTRTIIANETGKLYVSGSRADYKSANELVLNAPAFTAIDEDVLANDKSQLRLHQEETEQLNITFTQGFNILALQETIGELEFTSLNEAIAIVGEDGLVKALNSGKTQIKVEDKDNNITIYIPVEVIAKDVITNVQVVNSSNNTIILKSDGTVWAWGYNYYGTLGNGTRTESFQPVQVKSPDGEGYLENIVQIAAGQRHILALSKDGTVYAWGMQENGRLGNGLTAAAYISLPIIVENLPEIVEISAGQEFSMALDVNGKVWAWGKSDYGQLRTK
jgi:alpha-tubulin suppressor-like RCC1 family protein